MRGKVTKGDVALVRAFLKKVKESKVERTVIVNGVRYVMCDGLARMSDGRCDRCAALVQSTGGRCGRLIKVDP